MIVFDCNLLGIRLNRSACAERHDAAVEGSRCLDCAIGKAHAAGERPERWPDGKAIAFVEIPNEKIKHGHRSNKGAHVAAARVVNSAPMTTPKVGARPAPDAVKKSALEHASRITVPDAPGIDDKLDALAKGVEEIQRREIAGELPPALVLDAVEPAMRTTFEAMTELGDAIERGVQAMGDGIARAVDAMADALTKPSVATRPRGKAESFVRTELPFEMRMVEVEGKTRTVKAWAREHGISVETIRSRVKTDGMTIEQACSMGRQSSGPKIGSNRGGALYRDRLVTSNGVTRTIGEWCSIQGVTVEALKMRIKRGLTVENAVALKSGESVVDALYRQRLAEKNADVVERDSKPDNVETEENVCEHGDHPAPEGKRFCSTACEECERADCDEDDECAGICDSDRDSIDDENASKRAAETNARALEALRSDIMAVGGVLGPMMDRERKLPTHALISDAGDASIIDDGLALAAGVLAPEDVAEHVVPGIETTGGEFPVPRVEIDGPSFVQVAGPADPEASRVREGETRIPCWSCGSLATDDSLYARAMGCGLCGRQRVDLATLKGEDRLAVEVERQRIETEREAERETARKSDRVDALPSVFADLFRRPPENPVLSPGGVLARAGFPVVSEHRVPVGVVVYMGDAPATRKAWEEGPSDTLKRAGYDVASSIVVPSGRAVFVREPTEKG